MKNKIIWIIAIVMIFVTVQGAMADDFGSARFVSYYKFDDATADDQVNYEDGTIDGASNTSGYINSALNFDGNDFVQMGSTSGNYTHNKNFTINMWIYDTGWDWQKLFGRASGGTTNGVWLMTYNTGKLAFNIGDGSSSCNTNGAGNISPSTSTWTMITATYDGTAIKTYVDGAPDHGVDCTVTPGNEATAYWGTRNDLDEYFTGSIDEPSIALWMSDQEVLDLYNNMSAGNQFPFIAGPGAVPAGFVAPTPADNAHNSTQVTINVSCASGNHYLWFDNQSTPTTLVLDNTVTGNYTTSVSSDDHYRYIASCADDLTQNTSTINWYYDTTSPNIFLNPSNIFTVLNTSTTNQYNDSIFLNMTFTDNIDLFAYGINITSSNGTNMYGIVNTSISGLTYLLENTLNIGNYPMDTYSFLIQVADSHTAKAIPDYDVETGVLTTEKYIKFSTPSGNIITIKGDKQTDINFEKEGDRYSFSFNFTDGIYKTRNFFIESETDNVFHYLPESEYPGHIVILGNGLNGNWIDFAGTNITPEVQILNDRRIKLTYPNMGGNIKFKSIGGLNVEQTNYTWFRGNYTLNNPFGLISEISSLGINVGFGTGINDINANLYYNGSLSPGNVTKTNNNTHFFINSTFANVDVPANLSYYWEVTVNQTDGNFTYFNTSNQTHNVYAFGILACSGDANRTTVTFKYFDENYPAIPLSSNIEVEFESWIADPDNPVTFTANFTANQSHTFCLIPSDGTLQANVYARYAVNNGFTHRYILRNHTFNNVTQTFNLYNVNETTGYSDLKLTLRYKDSYGFYENVIAKLQKSYIGENVFRTVQMDRSGDFGLVFFNIIEENTDYRLVYTDLNNTAIKTTETLKFVCDAGICDLTELLDRVTTTTIAETLVKTTSFSNNSGNLSVVWSDPEGDTRNINVLVRQYLGNGTDYACNQSQSGSAGSFVCELKDYPGTVQYILYADGVPVASKYFDVDEAKLSDFLGEIEGAFWSFIIIAAVVLLSLASPLIAVIAAIVGLIITGLFGFFSPIGTTFIIIAAAIGMLIGFKIRR